MKHITAFFVIASCVLIFFVSIVLPDRASSVVENRSLAKLPTFSLQKLFSREFGKETDDYISDQMPFRDTFIKAYLKLSTKRNNIPNANYKQMVEGKEGYDYYIYDDNLILSLYSSKKNRDVAKAWTDKISEVHAVTADRKIPLLVDFVPSKAEALNDMLPNFLAENKDKPISDLIFNGIPDDILKVDTLSAFEKVPLGEKKDWYLHTDHHWNASGAFEGLKVLSTALSSSLQLNMLIKDDDFTYAEWPLKDFTGSYNQLLGYMYPRDELVGKYTPKDTKALSGLTLFVGKENVKNLAPANLSDYFEKKTQGPDASYASLTCDNFALMHLHNPSAKNQFRLLVSKDSYFNALILNLSAYLSDIYVVDTRYAKDFVLDDFLNDNPCDGVLLFYNSTAFMKTEEQLSFRTK